MNIFYRRPLCIILCIMLGGFSVFPFLTPVFKALFASSALILVVISSFLIMRVRKISFHAICSSLLLLSILLSFLYFDFYAKVDERFPARATIEGKIHEIKVIDEEDKIISYTIKTSSIDGQLALYKLTFTTSGAANDDISVGSMVSLSGRVMDYSTNDKEMSDYYFSLGIFGKVESVTNFSLVSQGLKPLSYYTAAMRKLMTDYSVSVSNEITGTFLSALLFGERQVLSPTLKTSFTNIGVSHVLALSGMHVTLLCLAINRLLLLLRVRRRERNITLIAVSITYMILTGMSISVVRAVLMMIISLILSLLFKSSDSITSLFLSVFIIILIAPYTVYSVSLWLSAFATLGVILSLDFIDIIPYKKSLARRALRFVFTSALSSVFALVSTTLLSSLIFKKFSTISLISTLIFSVLIEVIMYTGALMLALGKIIPVSFAINPIVDFTVWLADRFAKMKNAVISTNFYLDAFLVITTAIFAVIICIRVKSKRAVLVTVLTLLVVSTVPIVVYGTVSNKETSVYYTAEPDEDVMVVKDGDRCHVISYGNSYRNNSYEIYDILLEKNIHNIDTYVIFEISNNSVGEINSLLSRISVNTVLMPYIKYDSPEMVKTKLEFDEYLAKHGVALEYFSEGSEYTVDNFSFLPMTYKTEESSPRYVAYFATLADKKTLFLSSGILNSDYSRFSIGMLQSADTLILGKYGGSYYTNYYLDSFYKNLGEIVFSGDKIYLTPDMATRYEENGCKLTSHPSLYRLFD